MDIKSSLPVIVRYSIVTIMTALATRGLVSPEKGAFFTQNIDAVVQALIALGTVAYGLWRTPSARGLEVAREVDKKIPAAEPVKIQTPGNAPDIVVEASGSK